MTEKLQVTVEDAASAALNWAMALTATLAMKGVITNDEGNEIAAMAASSCEAAGKPNAAALIRNIVPTSADIDIVAALAKKGVKVEQGD